MKIYTILLFLGWALLIGADTYEEDKTDLNEEILFTALFTKLNTILEQNSYIINLIKISERLEKLDENLRKIQEREEKQDETLKKLREREEKPDETLKILQEREEKQDETLEKLQKREEKQDETLEKLQQREEKQDETLEKLQEREEKQDETLEKLQEREEKQDGNLKKIQERQEQQENLYHNKTLELYNMLNTNLSERLEKQEFILKNFIGSIEFIQRQINGIICPLNYHTKNNTEWTVIQRRKDGSVDFYRNWNDYRNGFGNPDGEFFIGLECLHKLTTDGAPQELEIVMKNFKGQTKSAKYDRFVIGSESEKYLLKELGNYSGDAGDSLEDLKGNEFTTKDNDNDAVSGNCADYSVGGWWFHDCLISNLNCQYYHNSNVPYGLGIRWRTWPHNPLMYVEMKIRPAT